MCFSMLTTHVTFRDRFVKKIDVLPKFLLEHSMNDYLKRAIKFSRKIGAFIPTILLGSCHGTNYIT
jgi:hypothetical protein